jgi:hypothetical protein
VLRFLPVFTVHTNSPHLEMARARNPLRKKAAAAKGAAKSGGLRFLRGTYTLSSLMMLTLFHPS